MKKKRTPIPIVPQNRLTFKNKKPDAAGDSHPARPAFHIQKMSVREACKPSSVIGGHLSRPAVTSRFKRNPESSTGRLKRSFVSCCEWGLHRGRVARPRVSSYLTFPPLHTPEGACGISLLHFPWGRPRRVLPGTLPYAARTFLTPCGARPPGSLTNVGIIA